MRKAKREEILKTMQLLHSAHQKIKKITNADRPDVQNVLTACQECALLIGKEIFGELQKTKVVHIL